MPALSNPTQWRAKPYGVMGHLFILKPEAIFKARVNMVPNNDTYPVANIEYDNSSIGSPSVTERGMTVLFGTGEGQDDLGRNRLRQAINANRIRIALSSQGTNDGEVYIEDNAYITILDDFRFWWCPPRIEPDGTEYMDYRFAVEDNNINTPPVAVAGVGYAGTDGTIPLDSSDSYVTTPGATIASRAWTVGDGVFTVGDSSSTSPTVEFPAGFRWVKLTVTDSNGKVGRTRIPVYVEGEGSGQTTFENFIVTNRRLTPDGQEISFAIKEDVSFEDYPDGTLVIYWEDEYYASTQTSLAGPTGREHVKFIGYLQKERTTINPLLGATEITCVDIAQRMRSGPGYPWIIANAAAPVGWSEMDDLNIDRYMHFILHWTTTVLEIASFEWSGLGSTYVAPALESNQGDPWGQVQEMAEAICHRLTCDSRGRLRVLPDPMLQDVADRTSVTIVSLTADDYTDLEYDYNREPQVGWIDAAAVKARQDKFKAIIVQAPGAIPGQGNQQLTINHRLVETALEFRTQEGHRYARVNSRYSDFRLRLLHPGDAGIEPADMEWVNLTINDFEGVRGRTINARFLVKEVQYTYNHETGQRECWLTLEKETSGTAAMKYRDLEDEDDDDDDDDDDVIFKPNDPIDTEVDPANVAVIFEQSANLYRTLNFSDASPTWTSIASVGGGADSLLQFEEDPFSPYYIGTGETINGWLLCRQELYRVDDLTGICQLTLLLEFDENWHGNSMDVSKTTQNHVAVISQKPGQPETKVWWSTDGETFTESVVVAKSSHTSLYWKCGIWISALVPGKIYVTAINSTEDTTIGYISEDYGETWDEISPGVDGIYMESEWTGTRAGTHVVVPGESGETYFARMTASESLLMRGSNAAGVDITPSVSSVKYGTDPTRRQSYGVSATDSDVLGIVGVDYGGSELLPEFVAGDRGVFWSTDGGSSWTTVVAPDEDVDYRCCRVYGDGTMLLVGKDAAVGICTNGGAVTSKTGSGLGTSYLRDIWRRKT